MLTASFLLKLSVAGVEKRHATHQQKSNRGMPWHMFSATSVLSESMAHFPKPDWKALRAQRKQEQAESKPKRIRAMDALHLFQRDWFAKERGLGRRWGAASAEAWQRCKAEFAALSAERRAIYDSEATRSKLAAHVARQQRQLDARAAAAQSQPALPAPAREGGASSAAAANQRDDRLALMLRDAAAQEPETRLALKPPLPSVCQSLSASFVDQAGESTKKSPEYPMSPGTLVEKVKTPQFSVTKATTAFAREATQIASGLSMPDPVPFPRTCGAMCKSSHSQRDLAFQKRVCNLLLQLVKDSGFKPTDVCKAEILFAAEQYRSSEQPHETFYFALGSAAGQQAHHPAQANLSELKTVQAQEAGRSNSCWM